LAIKETDDGRVLLHCHAGCGVDQVLAAVGLEFDALFPPKPDKPGAGTKPTRLKLPPAQALEILALESMVIAIVGCDMAKNKVISDADHKRLIQAVGRVQQIAEAAR
jgi:hypothetical protein